MRKPTIAPLAALLIATPAAGQTTTDNPFPQPIEATRDVVVVGAGIVIGSLTVTRLAPGRIRTRRPTTS